MSSIQPSYIKSKVLRWKKEKGTEMHWWHIMSFKQFRTTAETFRDIIILLYFRRVLTFSHFHQSCCTLSIMFTGIVEAIGSKSLHSDPSTSHLLS